MGQYFLVANLQKKEFLNAHSLRQSAKLTGWSWIGNSITGQLHMLLRKDGAWFGDEVMVIGDYESEALAGHSREHSQFAPVVKKLHDRYKVSSIHEFVRDTFTDITEAGHQADRPRFYINHKTKVFIDTEKCPFDWAFYFSDEDCGAVSMDPLPLLLSISNGSGGSYFNEDNEHLVGLWAEQSQYLELTDDESDIPEGYTEFAPDFTMRSPKVPYTDKDKLIAEEKKHFMEMQKSATG